MYNAQNGQYENNQLVSDLRLSQWQCVAGSLVHSLIFWSSVLLAHSGLENKPSRDKRYGCK